jgi:hypothetical protein
MKIRNLRFSRMEGRRLAGFACRCMRTLDKHPGRSSRRLKRSAAACGARSVSPQYRCVRKSSCRALVLACPSSYPSWRSRQEPFTALPSPSISLNPNTAHAPRTQASTAARAILRAMNTVPAPLKWGAQRTILPPHTHFPPPASTRSPQEKINAQKCTTRYPPKTPPKLLPAARSALKTKRLYRIWLRLATSPPRSKNQKGCTKLPGHLTRRNVMQHGFSIFKTSTDARSAPARSARSVTAGSALLPTAQPHATQRNIILRIAMPLRPLAVRRQGLRQPVQRSPTNENHAQNCPVRLRRK